MKPALLCLTFLCGGVAAKEIKASEGTSAHTLAAPALGPSDTLYDASRFLSQATFGPSGASIDHVLALGYERWLAEQFSLPTTTFMSFIDTVTERYPDYQDVEEAWTRAAIDGPDQLRQRVANALLEIMVMADNNAYSDGVYMDTLLKDSFGNFRQLLEDVSLSPSMGVFLSSAQNDKPDPATGRNPDENFAREIMQLFSIGLVQLNLDGTPRLDSNGRTLPTYDQSIVVGTAHVFTGWTFFKSTGPDFFAPFEYRHPMVPIQDHHDVAEKKILNEVVLPANRTIEQDLKDTLDQIFNHPNVGPFIGKQLIQRLVTSNPSPEYVARVASVFNDNGKGIRGDLKAVVTSILLDPEARSLDLASGPSFGKQREPMIRTISLLRALNARITGGRWKLGIGKRTGQGPFLSPTVFNFFRPDYARPGPIQNAGLVSPEFQITNEYSVVIAQNFMRALVFESFTDNIVLDFSDEVALAGDSNALIDRIDLVFFAGGLPSDLREIIRAALESVPNTRLLDRARLAVHLAVTSPDYIIQK